MEDLADDLFHEILEGDEAGEASLLVDHEPQRNVPELQLLHDGDGLGGLREEGGLADDSLEGRLRAREELQEDLPGQDVSLHAVEIPVVDGEPSEPALLESLPDRLGRGRRVESEDGGTGRHHRADLQAVEVERPRRDLARLRVEAAGRGGLLEEGLELLAREARFDERGPVTEETQDEVRTGRQEPHDGVSEPREKRQGPRDGEGVSLGVAHRERFRDELAEDEREERNGDDDEPQRHVVGDLRGDPGRGESRGERRGESRAAERRRGRPDDRDPDLDRRQEALRVRPESSQARRPGPLLVDELGEARPAHRQDGDLGSRKEGVRENQGEDDEDLHLSLESSQYLPSEGSVRAPRGRIIPACPQT